MKKETKREVKRCLTSVFFLYVFSLLFSLFSLIFIIDKIPNPIKFILSFVFMAPVFLFAYIQGKSNGEKLFKENVHPALDDLHDAKEIKIPYYRCVYHVLGYVVPLLIIFVAAVITKSRATRLVGFAFTFPVVLLFSSVHVIDFAVVTPVTLAVAVPYVLLVGGAFVLGYVLRAHRLKAQHGNIQSELRSFNN